MKIDYFLVAVYLNMYSLANIVLRYMFLLWLELVYVVLSVVDFALPKCACGRSFAVKRNVTPCS
jgi:type III secretory pathway component EscU